MHRNIQKHYYHEKNYFITNHNTKFYNRYGAN